MAIKREKVKIGSLLLERGMITHAQLEEALKSQMIFGGRLGTNLVELGYLDEEALAYFLSENLGVPYAHPKTLLEIDPEIIALIPKNIAERYRVLPLEVKRKRLRLVMADPQDYDAIKEISFITGYTVEPMVTPELRLVQALDIHYHIERGTRYLAFRENLKEKEELERIAVKRTGPIEADQGTQPPEKTAPEQSAQSPAVEEKKTPVEGQAGEDLILRKVLELAERRKKMLMHRSGQSDGTVNQLDVPSCKEMVMTRLKAAQDRNAVGEALLGYIGSRFPLGAIVAVRGEMGLGWCATGSPQCDEFVPKLRIPLAVPSILKRAGANGFAESDGREDDPMDRMIRRLIGVEKFLKMAAAAVYYQSVTVCFLLAIGPDEVFTEDAVEELQIVAKEAGKAFGRLIRPLHKETT